MRFSAKVNPDNAGIVELTEMVQDHLEEYRIKKQDCLNTALVVEEAAGSLAAHAKENTKISVHTTSRFGRTTITLSSDGERFDLPENIEDSLFPSKEYSEDTQAVLRGIILKSRAEDLKYRHLHGKNTISFTILRSKKAFLFLTLGAMVLAILVGLLLSAIQSTSFNSFLNTYALVPLKTMYMNALKMVVAPVVFFSIVSCISQFTDLSELGRVGGRIFLLYILTTIFAVGIGIGAFYLFRPGNPLPADAVLQSATDITSKTMDVSIKDTIIGIVPSNFLDPFLSSNMLQLIFLAVISGIATGMIGRYSQLVKDIFNAFNDLFLKITSLIIRFMPIAVFCSICSMVMNMGVGTITSVLEMFGTFLFGIFCMLIVYSILMMVFGKTNPVAFFKVYAPSMIQVFSLASSNASIPINMEACDKLGIQKKISSLSIPLGATVNMDGTCIHLAIFALALAKTYGVEITGANMVAMIISIIILSLGAPGIPGSGLICLSVLITQLGVPAESIGLVMGIDALLGMLRTMNNCTGDVVVSKIVDQKEKERKTGRQ